jgi:aryl-alcohol dehydrogenase
MQMRAAVVREPGGPFLIEDLDLDEPRPDEIVVRVAGAGICHTDLVVRDQWFPVPLPVVLGHEGSGVVERVGSSVTKVQPGDHVVMSMSACRACSYCRTGPPGYCVSHYDINFGGRRPDGSATLSGPSGPVNGHFFSQSSFATHALATEHNVVKIDRDLPLELFGPLGCGVQTGAGAVINSLQARPGTSIAVFGAGAVGLSAVMAAQVSGCTTIIAVDIVPERLALARELGATHTIDGRGADGRSVDGRTGDTVEEIRDLTGAGCDYSVETTAVPAVARQAIESLALLGTCGLVGVPPTGTELTVEFHSVLFGRFVRGIIGGDAIAQLFIPKLIELWRQGRFPFDRLIRYYDFADIDTAAHDAEAGLTIKPVLRMPA